MLVSFLEQITLDFIQEPILELLTLLVHKIIVGLEPMLQTIFHRHRNISESTLVREPMKDFMQVRPQIILGSSWQKLIQGHILDQQIIWALYILGSVEILLRVMNLGVRLLISLADLQDSTQVQDFRHNNLFQESAASPHSMLVEHLLVLVLVTQVRETMQETTQVIIQVQE